MRIGDTFAPAPEGRRRDFGACERSPEFNASRVGKRLKLDDLGGADISVFHVRSMCTRAQVSTVKSCTNGTSVHSDGRAYVQTMASTISEREQAYREEVARYVAEVLEKHGWSQSEAARRIGQSHSTISRALGTKFETKYPTLLALAKASGIPLPETLAEAAAEIRMPVRPPPTPATVSAYVDDVLAAPLDVQKAFVEELTKRMALQKS